jgi:outer membrane murein-binding lipoprotein Lpp
MNIQWTAAWASVLVVLAAVIAGFMLSGSPREQRLERQDAVRVSDLQQLARAVDAFREERNALPDDLLGVVDGRRLSQLPRDPVTRMPYGYQPLPPDRYRLCGVFDRASETSEHAQFWAHPAGQHCYELEVTERGRR